MQSTNQTLLAKEQLTRFLQTTLAEALAYHPDGSDAVFFEGNDNSLSFFGPAPAALQEFGVLQYQINDPTNSAKSIELSLKAALPWSEDWQENSGLLSSFDTLEFAYLEASEEDASPQWRVQWEDRSTLPMAVKVTAAFKSAPSEPFTQLVKLQRPVSPHCRYDSLSRGCAR